MFGWWAYIILGYKAVPDERAQLKFSCNLNLQKAVKVVIWNLGTAIQALMHEQGQAFGVCLAN